jgi:hypothetical protein
MRLLNKIKKNILNYEKKTNTGFIWHEIKQAFSDGLKDYLSSTQNLFDLIMIILYSVSFALKYYTIFLVRSHMDAIGTESFWIRVAHMNETDLETQKDVFATFYWLNEGKLVQLSFVKLQSDFTFNLI